MILFLGIVQINLYNKGMKTNTFKHSKPYPAYVCKDLLMRCIKACINSKERINYIDKATTGCGFTYNFLRKDGFKLQDFINERGVIAIITPNTHTVRDLYLENLSVTQDVYYRCEGIRSDIDYKSARVIYTTPDSFLLLDLKSVKIGFIIIDEVHSFISDSSFRRSCRFEQYPDIKLIGVSATFPSTFKDSTFKIRGLKKKNINYFTVTNENKELCLATFLSKVEKPPTNEKYIFLTHSATVMLNIFKIAEGLNLKICLKVGNTLSFKALRYNGAYNKIVNNVGLENCDIILCSHASVCGWNLYGFKRVTIFTFNMSLQKGNFYEKFTLEDLKQLSGRPRNFDCTIDHYVFLNKKIDQVPYEHINELKSHAKGTYIQYVKEFWFVENLYVERDRDALSLLPPKVKINEPRFKLTNGRKTYYNKKWDFKERKFDSTLVPLKQKDLLLEDHQFRLSGVAVEDLQSFYLGTGFFIAYLGEVAIKLGLQSFRHNVKVVKYDEFEKLYDVDCFILENFNAYNEKIAQWLKRRRPRIIEKQANLLKRISDEHLAEFKKSLKAKDILRVFKTGSVFGISKEYELSFDYLPNIRRYQVQLLTLGNKETLFEIWNTLMGINIIAPKPYRVHNIFTQLGQKFIDFLKDGLKLPIYYKDQTEASPSCIRYYFRKAKDVKLPDECYQRPKHISLTDWVNSKRKDAKRRFGIIMNTPPTKKTNINTEGINHEYIEKGELLKLELHKQNSNYYLYSTKCEMIWWFGMRELVRFNATNKKQGVFISRLHDCIIVFDPLNVFATINPFLEIKDVVNNLLKIMH